MPLKHMKTIILIVLFLLIAVPATADLAPGRITVYSTPPGALACIDTTDCDTTVATFTAEGNTWHTVVVTENGYRLWTENVFVTSEQTSVVNAFLDLNPASTAIQVYVTPGGGTICLDNGECRLLGGLDGATGSTLFTGVSPGYHTLSVEAPAGYSDTTELVQVSLGRITDVSISLDPVIPSTTRATGSIRVYVDRTGSTICIDTVDCFVNVGGSSGPGTGTVVFNDVRADATHTITVAADGYRPVSRTVSVAQDLITTVDVSLPPIAGVTTAPALTTTLGTAPTGTTPPATMPLPTRSGLGAVPVLGALFLCGVVFLFLKGRE
jgi:hypothetical protein